MATENKAKLLEIYTEILMANGIVDKISDVIVNASGAKCEGMASITQCVTVKFQDKEKVPINLFVKVHTDNPSHEVMLNGLKAFEKEARFFMEYLPAAKELCKAKGLDNLINFYPKCYYGDESIIVLENLVEKGYEMNPHEKLHDFNTAVFALQTLAKHHAVSYALIQETGGEKRFFQRFPNLDHDGLATLVEMMAKYFEKSLETNITLLEKHKIDGDDKILAKLNSLLGTARDMFLEAIQCNKDVEKLLLLNHGDFKNNNMMFLKDKTNKIIGHVTFDLQVTLYNTPALDLVFYLFTSVIPNVRQSQLTELLNIYRTKLNEVSTDLGYPIELTSEDLLMQFRRKFKYGFLFASSMKGPGILMALFKEAKIDISMIDMNDLTNVMHSYFIKWIEENPEKGDEMAEEVRNLVNEYNQLEL